jgi:hypothetical protein
MSEDLLWVLSVKDVCDLVVAYAHELKGVSHEIKLPDHVMSVAEISPDNLAILSFEFELSICDLAQTRKLAQCAKQSSAIAWWDGKLLVQSGCEIIAHDPTGLEKPSLFFRAQSPVVNMAGFANGLIVAQDRNLTVVDSEGQVVSTCQHGSAITRMSKLDDENLAVHDGHHEAVYTRNLVLRMTAHCPSVCGELLVTHTQHSVSAGTQAYINAWHAKLQRAVHLPCETYISCAMSAGKFAFYRDGKVQVYDVENNHYIELQHPAAGHVHRLFELPDGRLAGLYDTLIVVWNWATGEFTTWPIRSRIILRVVITRHKVCIFYHNKILQIIA